MELLQIVQKGLPDDLPSDARLLVALSGGADSVCLLLALSQLGYRVEALHCNARLSAAGFAAPSPYLFLSVISARVATPSVMP